MSTGTQGIATHVASGADAVRSIVVIGASAGGVPALQTLVGALPHDLDATVLVVLHISPHSPSVLQSVLQRETGLPVHAANEDAAMQHGCIYVAANDRHLVVERGLVRVTRGPRECRVRPAIDVLFRSAAAAYGPNVVGVVLTGMLDDGTAGAWSIKDSGGTVLVQDPDGAQYPSMPQSVVNHVDVDCVAPLEQLADEIVRRIALHHKLALVKSTNEQNVEVAIALAGNGLQAGVMELGQLSKYTCPECHGVLVQIEDGKIIRFRCHTGHAYSIKTLLAEVNDSIDKGLWATLRALEERILLLQQLGDVADKHADSASAAQARTQSASVEERARIVRALVLDPHLSSELGTAH